MVKTGSIGIGGFSIRTLAREARAGSNSHERIGQFSKSGRASERKTEEGEGLHYLLGKFKMP